MKHFYKKLAIMLAITLFVTQSLLAIQPASANVLIGKSEFSETTRNTNLTNKVEVFPSPIYKKDLTTNEWIPNSEGGRNGFPLYQTSISEEFPTRNLSSESNVVAGLQNSMQNLMLLKFGNELPNLDGGLFNSAALTMFEVDKPVNWGYWDPTYINQSYSVHKVLTSWDGESVTWLDRPFLSDSYVDKTLSIGVDGGHFQWDVSRMVAEWYQNPTTDYGLAITGKEQDSFRHFYTSKGYANKSYNQMDKAPRLAINYSPRPVINSARGFGLDANSSEGYVQLTWQSYQGVKGYKLSIFNGKEYETIDIGMTNTWTSLDKNVWPSSEEIKAGAYQLKLDRSGTNLPDNPSTLYANAGGTDKDPNRYYFKITSYNEFGESSASEEISVLIPIRTAPSPVSNIKVTDFTSGKVTLKWDSADNDIKEYRVKLGTTPEKTDIASGLITSKNEISVASSTLLPRSTIYVSINTIDNEGNFSSYSEPIPFSLGYNKDATFIGSSIPLNNSITSDPSMFITMRNSGTEAWTLEEGFELKAVYGVNFVMVDPLMEGEVIAPNETKTFQLRIIGKKPLGTVPLQFQMYHRDTGFFGDRFSGTITFLDTIQPEVAILTPKPSASLYKTVDIVGTVTDDTIQEYRLSYGVGSSPPTWKLISNGSSEVKNDKLGSWDTNNLSTGLYKLKLEATDKAGNTNSVVREVYVNLPISMPGVNKVTDQTTKVTGIADHGVTVFVQNGDRILGSSPVTNVGSYSVSIPKQLEGTILKVFAKNMYDVSSDVTSVKVVDGTPPSAPKINNIGDSDTKVSGSAEKGSTVTVKTGTTTLGSSQVNSEGKYSVTISKQKAGTTLSVTAKDAAGNVSAASTKIVVDKTPPSSPKVNEIGDNATSVKGKAEKGSTVTVKKGTKILGSSKVKTDGTFTVTIPKQKAGTALNVTAKDEAGNVSDVTNTTVADKTAPKAPVVNTVYSSSTVVKGNTEANATVTVKKGSKTLGSAKASSTGAYTVNITKQSKKTVLSVTVKDAAGNQSNATSITVK